MKILGVDPGSKVTGYGVIEIAKETSSAIRLLEVGTIEPGNIKLFQDKIKIVYSNLSNVILEHNPDLMVLEKLYSHSNHPTTACIMGHARGVICLLCSQHNIQLAECSVKRIRKALLGNGNATKKQTQETVAQVLKIDASKLTLDASDALALAIGYAFMQRFVNQGMIIR